MKNDSIWDYLYTFYLVGEDIDVPDDDTTDDEENDDKTQPEPKGREKKFSQKEVNSFLSKERKKYISQLEELKKAKGLSEEEREQLQDRIESLAATNQNTAKEWERKYNKALKDSENKIATITGERDTWANRYNDDFVKMSIVTAASAGDNRAYNPNQVLSILKPMASMQERLNEDGTPSGSFETKVNYSGKDSDGKPISIEANVSEALKLMMEDPDHQNLFVSSKKPGLGGFGGSQTKPGRASKDPKTYQEQRAAAKKAGTQWTP